MSDTKTQSKLVQYLSEAHGKERELETALEAHIGMTTRKPYRQHLQQHLKETKSHARELERRIKQLGGGNTALAGKVAGQAVGKAKSLAKGPLHLVRGTGEAEKMLKNAKTEYFSEHEEIATYTAIETLAESLGDAETAKLARAIRRDEERMANYLAKQIPVLTKAVIAEEIPAQERRQDGGGRRRRSTSTSKSRTGSTGKSRASASKSRSRSSSKSRGRSRSSAASR
ncbi:MAG TPA: DUF892 family protein [Solirubrobacterales bacterium]|nr:DUF892 family protein [Solirubrobacterales bacterium]